jgi:hypothetical protein
MYTKTKEALDGVASGFCSGAMLIAAEEEIKKRATEARDIKRRVAAFRKLLGMTCKSSDAEVLDEAYRRLLAA